MVLDRWFHENDLVANYIEMISHAENAEAARDTSDD